MIFFVAWFLIGATIFLSTFYLAIYWSQSEEETFSQLEKWPSIAILMPAYNEERVVEKSIESAINLDYPDLEVLFVDDGSTDRTLQKAREYENHPNLKIIEHGQNKGKAAALNTGLDITDAKYVAVQDADSRVEDNLVKKAVTQLEASPEKGAVIGSIKSFEHDTIIQKLQRIQYRLTNFYRSLMAQIGTLDVTPGAFSIYRAEDVKKVNGFDVGNPTEDLEMAWKLREEGKDLGMVFGDYSSTHYPKSLKGLYRQRVRWKRGSLFNSFRYRHMFLDSSYGWFGVLQLPIHIITPLLAAASLILVILGIGEHLYNMAISFSAVGFSLPVFRFDLVRMILGLQMKIYAPLIVALVMTAYIIREAYTKAGEDVRHPGALAIYYLGYFVFEAVFVIAAILKELFRTKRIWT